MSEPNLKAMTQSELLKYLEYDFMPRLLPKLANFKNLEAENARLKAEVERLNAELSNISGWGRGLESDLSHARVEISFLKSEVERLTERNKFLEQIDSYLQGANENAYEKRCDELEAEVEELKRMLEASTFGIEFAKEDIKKLEAEVERLTNCKSEADRLKAEVERLRASSFVTAVPVDEYEKLKAEVERLRKAGDNMADYIMVVPGTPMAHVYLIDWNAAKEGKPHA